MIQQKNTWKVTDFNNIWIHVKIPWGLIEEYTTLESNMLPTKSPVFSEQKILSLEISYAIFRA